MYLNVPELYIKYVSSIVAQLSWGLGGPTDCLVLPSLVSEVPWEASAEEISTFCGRTDEHENNFIEASQWGLSDACLSQLMADCGVGCCLVESCLFLLDFVILKK